MRDNGSAIIKPDDDNWNRIVMHNVDQFRQEQENIKQRAKENQARMKEELEKQVNLQKRAKIEEKNKELEYMSSLK